MRAFFKRLAFWRRHGRFEYFYDPEKKEYRFREIFGGQR